MASCGNGRVRKHEKQLASSGNGMVREQDNRNVSVSVNKKPVTKKRPLDDEDADPIDLIREMFNYNPNRYARRDEDDSDMEVGFDVIQKEERRMSKIARKEEEDQWRLIEEEEQRQREVFRLKKLMSDSNSDVNGTKDRWPHQIQVDQGAV